MAKSLQDQLLALGLAKESATQGGRKPAQRKEKKPGRPTGRKRSHPKAPTQDANHPEFSLAEAYKLREKQTRDKAEQAKERKRQEDRRRRQLNNAIRAIVQEGRLNDPSAELARNFMYKGRIRKVNVTADQLKALNSGEIGLVYLSGGYHLLSSEQVARVTELSAEHVPDLSGPEEDDEEFPVPDDLVW